MRFLLQVSCSTPDMSGPVEAIVTLDVEGAERLLQRRAIFLGLRAYDPELYEMYFWSSLCEMVDDGENLEEGEPLYDTLQDQLGHQLGGPEGVGYLLIHVAELQYHVARTDADQAVVSSTGVAFLARMHHGDEALTTVELPWSEIERVAAGEPPAKEGEAPAPREVREGFSRPDGACCAACLDDKEVATAIGNKLPRFTPGTDFSCVRCNGLYRTEELDQT